MSQPDYKALVRENSHLKSYSVYANRDGKTLLLVISTKYLGRGGHWVELDRITLHFQKPHKQKERAEMRSKDWF